MLEVGYFHADPHPGNLVAITDGSLAYFDFGMMGDIPRHYRIGLIQMVRNSITHCNGCNLLTSYNLHYILRRLYCKNMFEKFKLT